MKIYEVVIEKYERAYDTDQPTFFGIVASESADDLDAVGLGYPDNTLYSYKVTSVREVGTLTNTSALVAPQNVTLPKVYVLSSTWVY